MRESDAAIYLGLTVRTLRNYRRKGTLAYREAPGTTRPSIEYDQAELDRLKQALEAQRTAGPKPRPAGKSVRRRVTFGLPPDSYTELTEEAQRYGWTASDYARRLVREGLESRFQTEASELRAEVNRLKADLERTRKEFASGFEAVLEFSGLDPAEAKRWVTENLR